TSKGTGILAESDQLKNLIGKSHNLISTMGKYNEMIINNSEYLTEQDKKTLQSLYKIKKVWKEQIHQPLNKMLIAEQKAEKLEKKAKDARKSADEFHKEAEKAHKSADEFHKEAEKARKSTDEFHKEAEKARKAAEKAHRDAGKTHEEAM